MNILFLTPRGSRKNLGGVEGHVRILTGELEKRGHQVRELSLSEVGAPVVRLPLPWSPSTSRGVATTGFGRTGDFFRRKKSGPSEKLSLDESINFSKLRAWGYLWKRRDLFKWADVVHVHDVFWWYFPFTVINKGPALLQQQGRAFVGVTFHGWEGDCPPTRSAVWQKKLAQKLSQGTIGVGDFFKKWYGVKTDRIVWGVMSPEINKGPAFRLAKDRALRQIVFLGRLEKVNGIEVLLETMDKYYKSYKDYKNQGMKFIFVGDGSYRKQAEKFGKVTGMVKNPQKYLTDADVVITSSYMSMLEATAMGKPIIAVGNNELKMDYLDGHPLRKYIKVVKNADELIKTIRGLYEGPALLQQQGRALKDIENARFWALKQTQKKLADIYEGLWNLR